MFRDRSYDRIHAAPYESQYENSYNALAAPRDRPSQGKTTSSAESDEEEHTRHGILTASPNYPPQNRNRDLIDAVSKAIPSHRGHGGSGAEVLKLSMDIHRLRTEFANLHKVVHVLEKGLETAKEGYETKEMVYNKTLTQMVANIDDLVRKEQDSNADIANLTTGLAKIARVHNKNNAVTDKMLGELDLSLQSLLQQHNALQKWIYATMDEVQQAQQVLERDSADRKEQLDMSISITLGKIDDFISLNDNFDDSYQKCQQMCETVEVFQKMCTDHSLVTKRLDELESLKELSQRLIKRLNELGFDENESLSIHSRIAWNVDVKQIRQRLTLLSYACFPFPESFMHILSTRPTSPECSLLLPGAGEYFFRLEIGEHPSFPQYLGIYIHVDGSQFPVTLEGTALTFLGKKFEYTFYDICAQPTCSCFRVLISYKDAARMILT
jgi:hypothetical protein